MHDAAILLSLGTLFGINVSHPVPKPLYLVSEAVQNFLLPAYPDFTLRAAVKQTAKMAATFGQTRTCFAAATAPVASRGGRKVGR